MSARLTVALCDEWLATLPDPEPRTWDRGCAPAWKIFPEWAAELERITGRRVPLWHTNPVSIRGHVARARRILVQALDT